MATQAQTSTVDLVKIESIDDIFEALRAINAGFLVNVTDELGRTFILSVRSLSHEDDSGRSFVIGGFAHLNCTTTEKAREMGTKRYEAYLNYKDGDRKGWIKILD